MRKINLRFNHHIDNMKSMPYGMQHIKRYAAPTLIEVDLAAYVTEEELNILNSQIEISILGCSATYSPVTIQQVAASPVVPLTFPAPKSKEPWHSVALDKSEAFGKYSFEAAKQEYKLCCEHCHKEFSTETEGRIVEGRVFMAKLANDKPIGGLIGSASNKDLRTVMCVVCFKKACQL